MPTLLIKNGFKFFFYANEHEPRHVHVTKGDGYFKIELTDLHITNNHMEAHKDKFKRRWDEYFS